MAKVEHIEDSGRAFVTGMALESARGRCRPNAHRPPQPLTHHCCQNGRVDGKEVAELPVAKIKCTRGGEVT